MNFSVLISVYKNENPTFLRCAIVSIWDKQILKPSEIVLVKDGPLGENLEDEIRNQKRKLGEKLKIISLEKNVGLGKALNEGLKKCNHNLVARMDTDDMALPHRFSTQIPFMENNPHIAVASALIEEIDEEGKRQSIRKIPKEHKEIVEFSKMRNPISHPVAIFRRDAVLSVGGYPDFKKSQDYALWSLMLNEGFRFANQDEILLKMRTGHDLFDRRNVDYFWHEYQILKYQKKIGFISLLIFIRNFFLRFVLRISPSALKQVLYKYFRNG